MCARRDLMNFALWFDVAGASQMHVALIPRDALAHFMTWTDGIMEPFFTVKSNKSYQPNYLT